MIRPHTLLSTLAKSRLGWFAAHLKGRISSLVTNVRDSLLPDMDYVPGGWGAAKVNSAGWTDLSVAEAQEKHWPTLVGNLQGPGPLGVAHFPWSVTRDNRTHHNAMMSYGYVLARAARRKDEIAILDWGGGVGHYFLYSKALLPDVAIEYHCFDVPSLCAVGKRLQPDGQFHDCDGSLQGKSFDLVISSSSLHYFEHWRAIVSTLTSLSRDYLYIARLQTVVRTSSFVVVHNVNRSGYGEFLSWCINRDELIAAVEQCGFDLAREFVYAQNWSIRGISEKAETRGFLFRRRRADGRR